LGGGAWAPQAHGWLRPWNEAMSEIGLPLNNIVQVLSADIGSQTAPDLDLCKYS